MKELVSIIIPNYNHAAYLKQRIESVLNQTYQNFELIILDDASTDNSKEIIRLYKNHHKVSQIVFNETNSGSPFKQWQKGISLAKGTFIWIAESDDFSAPEFLQTAINTFTNNPGTSVFYCQSTEVDESGNIISQKWRMPANYFNIDLFNQSHCKSGTEYIQNYLFYINVIPNAGGVVFKTSEAKKHIHRITDFKMCGDWLFWILLLQQGNICFFEKSLNYFRLSLHNTRRHNTLTKKMARIIEEAKILDTILSMNLDISPQKKDERLKILLDKWCYTFPLYQIINTHFFKLATVHFNHLTITKIMLLKHYLWLKLNRLKK